MEQLQRRLVKQSYELVERLESARRHIYERAQSRGDAGFASTAHALAHAQRLLVVETHARARHARRMRTARTATS